MNILYISHLTTRKSEGPNNSVPAQVKAQSKYDCVFWWNLTEAVQSHWIETGLFHGIREYPNKEIKSLPAPFYKPDLVVFEGFYYLDDVILSWECRKRRIPYVIVARGTFTWQGQAQKKLKKKIANFVAFKSMVTHAASIQYLTKQEFLDSGEKWNRSYYIMPNGTYQQRNLSPKQAELCGKINGVCIGRFDPYQKGLDLLLEAVDQRKDALRDKGITISLYGPERMTCKEDFGRQIVDRKLEDILIIKDGVFGEDKERVLREADFFIMTSRYEGMPMSMIEAMSYGVPCLATKGTNLSEEIESNKAGWSCETSVKGIVSAFDALINDIGKFGEYGKNALTLSREYDWDEIGRRTHEEYQRIVAKTL